MLEDDVFQPVFTAKEMCFLMIFGWPSLVYISFKSGPCLAMAKSTVLGALCVGIETYHSDDLKNLPGARRDVERFAEFLREKGLPEQRLHYLVGEVKKSALESSICQFTEMVKNISTQNPERRLIIIFIAAHGRQLHKSELPAVLPSDIASAECDQGLVDLDFSLLVPLDSVKPQKLKVWLVIDTCRENGGISTWTGNEHTSLRRLRWRSLTDFHVLLACDRGRLADDDQSLTDALIDAFSDPSKDTPSR